MKLSIALALASAGSALALVARQVSTLPTTVHLVPTLASWTTSTSGLIANGHWAVAPPAEYTVLPIVSETDVTSGKFYLQTSAGACYASISAPLFCSPVDIVPRAAFRLLTPTVSGTPALPALLELVGGTYNWSSDARPTNATGVSVYNGALTATRPVVFTIAVTPVCATCL